MLNISTFSVGDCSGQPMLFFWKLIDETQMPKPQENADTVPNDSYRFWADLPLEGHV